MKNDLLYFSVEMEGKKDEFGELHTMLQAIYFFASTLSWCLFKKKLIITSMYREGSSSVHGYHRGLDVDVDDHMAYGGLTPAEAEVITAAVNMTFRYDPARPSLHSAVYGSLDDSGVHWDHIHFQVCSAHETAFMGFWGR